VRGLARSVQAALRAVGAAGGGWALLAALRAATEATRSSSRQARAAEKRGEAADAVPQHVAVIMDGNRRFGRKAYGDTLSGHRAGGEKLRDFLEWCVEAGVGYLTVFAFSTENWKREKAEVDAMMRLFLTEVPKLGERTARLNVRVKFLCSDAAPLSPEVRAAISELETASASCTGLLLSVCLSYGSRGEVATACRELAADVAAGRLRPEDIDESAISQRLLTSDLPDPDVLIRTSGERRLSNFLMYQLAYTELFFLDKHWPEVSREDLLGVFAHYGLRQRRFGR